MVLPSLEDFASFPCIGPSGLELTDINGCAASTECFLDLRGRGLPEPLVRWTNYKEDVVRYQGALEHKDRFSKAFYDHAGRDDAYDTSKLSRILDAIVSVCSTMSTDILVREVDE